MAGGHVPTASPAVERVVPRVEDRPVVEGAWPTAAVPSPAPTEAGARPIQSSTAAAIATTPAAPYATARSGRTTGRAPSASRHLLERDLEARLARQRRRALVALGAVRLEAPRSGPRRARPARRAPAPPPSRAARSCRSSSPSSADRSFARTSHRICRTRCSDRPTRSATSAWLRPSPPYASRKTFLAEAEQPARTSTAQRTRSSRDAGATPRRRGDRRGTAATAGSSMGS